MISPAESFMVAKEPRDDPSRHTRDVDLEVERRARVPLDFSEEECGVFDGEDECRRSDVLEDGDRSSRFDDGAEEAILACSTLGWELNQGTC